MTVTIAAVRLAELIREADGSVVALTGAGISVPSGIPDFRSPGTGLWENVDPMKVAHIDAFQRDPEEFWRFYGQRFALLQEKRPNRAHLVLASLEARGLLRAVITQNIDGLHQSAGSRDVVEVHGSVRTSSCLECGAVLGMQEVRGMLPAVPRCACGFALKPDVVLFGEFLPEEALARATVLCGAASLLLVVGSSLEVFPVAGLPEITIAAGGRIAIVTQSSTPYDSEATVRLNGDVVEELEAVFEAVQ